MDVDEIHCDLSSCFHVLAASNFKLHAACESCYVYVI